MTKDDRTNLEKSTHKYWIYKDNTLVNMMLSLFIIKLGPLYLLSLTKILPFVVIRIFLMIIFKLYAVFLFSWIACFAIREFMSVLIFIRDASFGFLFTMLAALVDSLMLY